MTERDESPTSNRPVVRPAAPEDARDVARIRVDCWRLDYRGLLPDSLVDGASYEEDERVMRQYLTDPSNSAQTHIAQTEGETVGFVVTGPERMADAVFRGEIWAIYVDPARQRTGAGTALLRVAAKTLEDRGLAPMLVWALAGNAGARAFYEKAGGQLMAARVTRFEGHARPEVAYGWPRGLMVQGHDQTEARFLSPDRYEMMGDL